MPFSNRRREIIFLGMSGTQAWPAWNCRRTHPSLSPKRGLPWTTHHLTPDVCSRRFSAGTGMEHEFTALGCVAPAAIPDHAATMASWVEVDNCIGLFLSLTHLTTFTTPCSLGHHLAFPWAELQCALLWYSSNTVFLWGKHVPSASYKSLFSCLQY